MIEIVDSPERQTTIARPQQMDGLAASDFLPCSCRLLPAPADYGIRFSLAGQQVPATVQHYDWDETRHTSSLRLGEHKIQTVEHLLSAVSGMGIDNLDIRLDSCGIPFQDFSADFFVASLAAAGRKYLDRPRRLARIVCDFELKASGSRHFRFRPGRKLRCELISTIEFPYPIGLQSAYFDSERDNYRQEIAWARSFICSPLGENGDKWARIRRLFPILPQDPKKSSLIAYDRGGYLTPLRSPDEPARHKLLDLIGDLSLLGYRIAGQVEVFKPGHRFTAEIVSRLREMIA